MIDLAGRLEELVDGGRHITKFMGFVYYVDAGIAVSGNGIDPHHAFATITEGFAVMLAGDRLVVKAGVYDEDGLDMALDGMELICEFGTRISNTNPGTCLTVSGDTCFIRGLGDQQAGQVGCGNTGKGRYLEGCIRKDKPIA